MTECLDILLPIEKIPAKRPPKPVFLEENVPQDLQPYDAFVRYILANVKDGDVMI